MPPEPLVADEVQGILSDEGHWYARRGPHLVAGPFRSKHETEAWIRSIDYPLQPKAS